MDAGLSHVAASFALWLGVALLGAKLAAEFFQRALRQPAVVGELLVGVALGPFAIGALELPVVGRLFPQPDTGAISVPEPLWLFGQVAAVLLLFGAGLESNFATLMRFGPAAISVALGGVAVPFLLGDMAAVAMGLASHPLDAHALFLGAVLTATSIGVTARVLSDIGKLDTPEGTTILGAAVLDDVIGVIVLALVVAVGTSSTLAPLEVGAIGIRTVFLWLVFTAILFVLASRVGRIIGRFRTDGAILGLTIAVALLSGFVAESIGLAMIIGAYSAGLALSRSELRSRLEPEVRIVQHAIVPAFFVTMGMLVDLRALAPVLGFGLVLSFLAAIGKILGCSVPALFTGFNRVGSLRIGLGMMPRGEVALIIAGVGLTTGAVDEAVFSVAVLVAILTTVAAPVLLVPAFGIGGPGVREHAAQRPTGSARSLALASGLADILESQLVRVLVAHGFKKAGAWTDPHGARGVQMEREGTVLSLALRDEAGDRRRLDLDTEESLFDFDMIISEAVANANREAAEAFAGVRRPPETV